MNLKSLNYVFLVFALVLCASCGSGIAPVSDDTTLNPATSTVKGVTLDTTGNSLGTPGSVLDSDSVVLGSVYISSTQAEDTTNSGNYITQFVPNNPDATTKVVKYDNAASVDTNFENALPYDNEAIVDGNVFIVQVTAPAATVLFYGIRVTIVLSTDATLSATSTVKDVEIGGTTGSLGTGATTLAGLGVGTPGILGSVTVPIAQAEDAVGAYVTEFIPTDSRVADVRVVQYVNPPDLTHFETAPLDAEYNGRDAIDDVVHGKVFVIKVTAEDNLTVRYYGILVTIDLGPSTDATLRSLSTLKGVSFNGAIGSLGTPFTSLADVVIDLGLNGALTLTNNQGTDTTGEGIYITNFVKGDLNAQVRVAQYTDAPFTSFNSHLYNNGAINNDVGRYILVEVTAEDPAYVNYYLIKVRVRLTPGDSYQGGIVAYLCKPSDTYNCYVTGQIHGLVAATDDESSTKVWSNISDQATVTSMGIGYGLENTNNIVNETVGLTKASLTVTPNIAGIKASYSGKPFVNGGETGLPMYLEAVTSGVSGNDIHLHSDGATSINALIAAWNLDNPTNTLLINPASPGTQIPDNGQTFTLIGGTTGGAGVQVILSADNRGVAGNDIHLDFDGAHSINDLILAWNIGHASNALSISDSGTGDQVPATGQIFTLVGGTSTTNTDGAALQCSNMSVTEGSTTYSDWYLPSISEAVGLYNNRVVIGHFDLTGVYWSSSGTAVSKLQAFAGNFDGGTPYTSLKSASHKVRCIHSF